MLTHPTPRENPVPMIALLQSYLRSDGLGPEAIASAQADARAAATRALLASAPLLRRTGLRIVLRATQGAIRMRERARMKQALLYTRLRHVLLRIGDVLVAQGALDRREDVFFLEVDEIRRDSRQANRREPKGRARGIRPRPAARQLHARGGRGMEARRERPSAPIDERAILRGTSACGGATRGIAHVIEDVAGIGAFRSGEILVTRQTDPDGRRCSSW
jgi:pyruvate,water dikinase